MKVKIWKFIAWGVLIAAGTCIAVAIASAQPSDDWKLIKKLALSGMENPRIPGQWVKSWELEDGRTWSCYYYPHNEVIQWSEIWFPDGVRTHVVCTYWGAGENAGRFMMTWRLRGETTPARTLYLAYAEGITRGRLFISDIRPFLINEGWIIDGKSI